MPASRPATRSASSARAVSAMTGVSARARSSLRRSMPFASGSPRSRTTSAGFTSSKSTRARAPDGAPMIPREHVGAARALELEEAGRRMGLASVTCLKYPDGDLASVKEEYVVRDIVRWLRKVRPDVVIAWGPDGGYGHPDHIAAGERALKAIELAGIQRHEPALGAHWHVRRCYRFVASADFVDGLRGINQHL